MSIVSAIVQCEPVLSVHILITIDYFGVPRNKKGIPLLRMTFPEKKCTTQKNYLDVRVLMD